MSVLYDLVTDLNYFVAEQATVNFYLIDPLKYIEESQHEIVKSRIEKVPEFDNQECLLITIDMTEVDDAEAFLFELGDEKLVFLMDISYDEGVVTVAIPENVETEFTLITLLSQYNLQSQIRYKWNEERHSIDEVSYDIDTKEPLRSTSTTCLNSLAERFDEPPTVKEKKKKEMPSYLSLAVDNERKLH